MKMSINHMLGTKFFVTQDGNLIKNCISVDTIAGKAVVYDTEEDGKLKIDCASHELKTKEVTGNFELLVSSKNIHLIAQHMSKEECQ